MRWGTSLADHEQPRVRSRQAVLTGASSGIGAAVASRLLDIGFELTSVGRSDPSIGDRHVSLDLSDPAAVARRAESLAKDLERLAVVVLAGGLGRFGSLEEFSPDQIRELIDVDLVSNMILCRYLVPRLKQLGGGQIVLIGSESGLRGARQGAVYCAAKFGLRGFAQALRDECAQANVRIGIVQPGMVRTSFFDELGFEPGPRPENALEAADVADAVQYMLDAPDHAVVDEIELTPRVRVVRKRPVRGDSVPSSNSGSE